MDLGGIVNEHYRGLIFGVQATPHPFVCSWLHGMARGIVLTVYGS